MRKSVFQVKKEEINKNNLATLHTFSIKRGAFCSEQAFISITNYK